MAWKVRLVWVNEVIDIDGEYDSEEEAKEAGYEAISTFHQGNAVLTMSGEDYSDDEPDVETYED